MKISISVNVNCEVEDTLVDNYLIKENITLQEHKDSLEKTVYEMFNDEMGEEFENKNIEVKVYFEKED